MYATPFIDETFDINNCQNYILSIQCALDGFSFSILDKTVNKFIVLGNHELNTATPFELKTKLESLYNSEQILQNKFKHVKICFVSSKICIVPNSLINEQNNELFEFTFEHSRDDKIVKNNISTDKASFIAIPELIKSLFEGYYTNSEFYSTIAPILNYAKNYNVASSRLFVSKYNHTLQILALNKNNIEFLNTFYVKNDADCLYYILNTAKSLATFSKPEIIILGKLDNNSYLEKTLKNYFEKVITGKFSSKYAVSYTFMSEPENNYLPLIELALCEL